MLEFVSLLSAPIFWLAAAAGLGVGLAAAWLLHFAFGNAVPSDFLALIVAVCIVGGMVLGGLVENRKR